MSRSRDLADAGSKANFLDNVSADINTTYAPKASPAFTGTPTGITASHLTTGTLGNTVQDNITRLGTVTTGTIDNTIGSNAIFPTGAVVNKTIIRENEHNTVPYGVWQNFLEGSYTYKATSSHNFVEWFTTSYKVTSNTTGFGVRIYKKTSGSGVTTSDYLIDDGNHYTTGGEAAYTFHAYYPAYWYGGPRSMQLLDTQTHSAGDTVYYAIFYRRYDSTGTINIPYEDQDSNVSGSQITKPNHGLVITEVMI
tara:strand:+ start:7185 stop:7940 length:756 start_codon:yes stop_codon:yes gene_type:complete